MKYECFEVTVESAVAHVRMSRPDKLNAMTPAFFQELTAIARDLDEAGQARCLVLSSSGKHFCAGMDLSVFQDETLLRNQSARDREQLRHLVLTMQRAFTALEQMRMPVIAAVQGGCIGAGMDLVCACDMRFATNDAFFQVAEINLAMMADLGTLQRLPQLLPQGVVRELAYTGDRLSAERALSLGFVSGVPGDHEVLVKHVLAMGHRIAEHSPLALAATKEALIYAQEHTVAESLHYAATLQAAIFEPEDVRAAALAQKTKTRAGLADLPARKSLVPAG